jgi:hypothetical protein
MAQCLSDFWLCIRVDIELYRSEGQGFKPFMNGITCDIPKLMPLFTEQAGTDGAFATWARGDVTALKLQESRK